MSPFQVTLLMWKVIITDYISRRGNIHVPSLYKASKESPYWFWSGINVFAVTAWIAGVALGLPGLVGEYQPQAVNSAAKNMFKMGWILTFAVAGIVYAFFWVIKGFRVLPRSGSGIRWEGLAKETEGVITSEELIKTG